jgi:hypothetical protein
VPANKAMNPKYLKNEKSQGHKGPATSSPLSGSLAENLYILVNFSFDKLTKLK